MPSVAYGTGSIAFEVVRKSRMKNTYLEDYKLQEEKIKAFEKLI